MNEINEQSSIQIDRTSKMSNAEAAHILFNLCEGSRFRLRLFVWSQYHQVSITSQFDSCDLIYSLILSKALCLEL